MTKAQAARAKQAEQRPPLRVGRFKHTIPPATSWWTEAPRNGFTRVCRAEYPRMSPLGTLPGQRSGVEVVW